MTQEIEIKFCLNPDFHADIAGFIEEICAKEQKINNLGNSYFDTPDLALRRLDMGLRIRRWGDQAEQTIKCRGQGVGGLHSRPEYNAPVSGDTPDLALFPATIWPQGCDVAALQQALSPLFRTDFARTTWQVVYQGAEIELAHDRGEIEGRLGREPIDELELELKSGPAVALFELAARLLALGGLRPGHQSKAQRGYLLAGQGTPWALRGTPLPGDLAGLVDDLQHHEACLLAQVDGAAPRITAAARALLAQAQGQAWQAPLRRWLAAWEASPDAARLYQPDYGAFLLAISRQLHGA